MSKKLPNEVKAAIALLAGLFTEVAKEVECPPPVFVAACAAAGKAMVNKIEGKPVDTGLDWLDPDQSDGQPVPGEPPTTVRI